MTPPTWVLLFSTIITPSLSSAIPSKPTKIQQLILEADQAASTLPVPPSLDPWYRAPSSNTSWETTTLPGDVLKIRPAPLLNTTVANALAAYQILYRSTDSAHQPSWDVTTLFIPRSLCTAPTLCPGAARLLSYQIPYDTCNVDASPSYALHAGEPYGEIADALGLGWFVSVPDYEGPLASYTAGVQSGHATLDGVRAVLKVLSDGSGSGPAETETKVALWGYSGGALASEWAAELHAQYAPELAIAGVALGGLTPNVTRVTEYINGREAAGLIPAGLLGTATQHPRAYEWLVGRLRPEYAAQFMAVRAMTAQQAIGTYQYQDIYGYFVGGRADLHVGVMEDMYAADGYMGFHGTPGMPLFVYKAVGDQVSPVGDTDELVGRFCEEGKGVSVLYHRNLAGGHNQELVNGRQRAFVWLGSVLDGSYEGVGCTVVNVTVNLTPLVPWN
ncbi:secretory lipase-domain-containing protein [Bombardia bombarda]|uniref:Secretory lipase-domain-containing protein n=1 Tax=Bombardia bombarda TaxID=252184 RepID=A0AA40CFR0_9PEZI|nr:secretory lipase-domain-containing protein [Bombardia bombarda]